MAVAKFKTEEEAIRSPTTPRTVSERASSPRTLPGACECRRYPGWYRMVQLLHGLSNAVPFGGYKASGIGRELGVDAIKEYTQVKSIHWNYGESLDWPLTGETPLRKIPPHPHSAIWHLRVV